jgi:hypothetical protein
MGRGGRAMTRWLLLAVLLLGTLARGESSRYYHLLFDGTLGFEVVYSGSRYPGLFDFHLKPDTFSWPDLNIPQPVTVYLDTVPGLNGGRVDESFTVYDQPLVIVFRNVERLSVEEMAEMFE